MKLTEKIISRLTFYLGQPKIGRFIKILDNSDIDFNGVRKFPKFSESLIKYNYNSARLKLCRIYIDPINKLICLSCIINSKVRDKPCSVSIIYDIDLNIRYVGVRYNSLEYIEVSDNYLVGNTLLCKELDIDTEFCIEFYSLTIRVNAYEFRKFINKISNEFNLIKMKSVYEVMTSLTKLNKFNELF